MLLPLTLFSITQEKEIYSISEVYEDMTQLLNSFKSEEILIVFDIDNTVLSMKDYLGSDQWFNWKRENLRNSATFSDLLEWQDILFTHGEMRLTERVIPKFIDELQMKKFKVIALTSRSPEYRRATERELSKYEIDFSSRKIGTDIKNQYYRERLIGYDNGIFMTSGLHKGEMLKILVEHSRVKNIKQIVFLDDHLKNTHRVFDQFKNSDSDILIYRYGKEDDAVKKFYNSSRLKNIADQKLIHLKETLDRIFGTSPNLI